MDKTKILPYVTLFYDYFLSKLSKLKNKIVKSSRLTVQFNNNKVIKNNILKENSKNL